MSTAPSSNSYVAIVDDDAAIRSALGRALRMENYDVELFEDGVSALKSIQLRAPDAIQLSCAAGAGTDLFITNDARLQSKQVAGIQFIVSLDQAPI